MNQYAPPQSQNHPPASQASILSDLFVAPEKAMRNLLTNPTILMPLIFFILINIGMIFYYFSQLDFTWFVDHMAQLEAGDQSKADMDRVRQGLEMFGSSGLMWMQVVSTLIGIPIIFAVMSGYLSLVSNIRGDGIKFKQWYSFTCWTALPGLISVIASIVMIALSDNGQLSLQEANPLSLNALFFDYPAEKGIGSLLTSLHLGAFWSWLVSIIGYAVWTKTNKGTAAAIILAPWVIIFGIWAAAVA